MRRRINAPSSKPAKWIAWFAKPMSAAQSFTKTPAGAAPAAAIFGVEGVRLKPEEREFFASAQPWGFILFQRNCESPEQIKALIKDLEDAVGRAPLPILIDQEGGRVARLKPPHWPSFPAAWDMAEAASAGDAEAAKQAIYANGRMIGACLHSLGITVDCAPVADLRIEGAHDIIGNRAYGRTPEQVAMLAQEMANGLLDAGVLPVVKHIPGHGRALADSHEDLPIVETPLEELEATDFAPFKALKDIPLGMTAHITFHALDAELPVTLSPKAIRYIREVIGFDGMLMSDDLSMKALKGDFTALTQQTLAAGCDLVLHCNGKMEEMTAIAKGLRPLDAKGLRRATRCAQMLKAPQSFDMADAKEAVDRALKLTTQVA